MNDYAAPLHSCKYRWLQAPATNFPNKFGSSSVPHVGAPDFVRVLSVSGLRGGLFRLRLGHLEHLSPFRGLSAARPDTRPSFSRRYPALLRHIRPSR
jgi:hypothetical protein